MLFDKHLGLCFNHSPKHLNCLAIWLTTDSMLIWEITSNTMLKIRDKTCGNPI